MADLIVLDAFRFARALGLDTARARRVAEPHDGETYTPDTALERAAVELVRRGSEVANG